MKKSLKKEELKVALWVRTTTESDGMMDEKKQLIGWFASYQEAKRHLRAAAAPIWSSAKSYSQYVEYDCFGWFPGQVVPREYRSKWRINSFIFGSKDEEVEYAILKPLDWRN